MQKNASPMQAAEEPPNLKNPNQRWRKLGRIAWDLAGSAFKIGVLGLLVVNESQIGNPLIKTGFKVRNTHRKIAPKYLRANLGWFETQI